MDILIISEDPAVIHETFERLRPLGITVRGCLGPANSACPLNHLGVCPHAAGCDISIVMAPPSGVFAHEWSVIPAGEYAERLAASTPTTRVVLCGAPVGPAGPSGTVVHADDRDAAIDLVEGLASVAAVPV